MKTIVAMALNPAIDKSSSVAHVVAERKLYCKPPRFEPGGGGVNVSRAIKKLGGESILLYPAGGLSGERLKALLDQEGLGHRPFPIEGLIRESLVILEESTGQQYRFGMPGPEFQEKEWEQFLQELSAIDPSPDYLVASGSLPPGVPADFYARVARIGKDRGVKTIIDVAGEALEQALKQGVYLIKPNVGEFRELVGKNIKEKSQIRAEAQKIVRSGRRHLSGGLRYCKAIGIDLKDRGIVQVSINMTDYTRTALYRVFELILIEARRWGVPVVGSEIVGLVPMGALIDTAAYYLQLENFKAEQVLESRI